MGTHSGLRLSSAEAVVSPSQNGDAECPLAKRDAISAPLPVGFSMLTLKHLEFCIASNVADGSFIFKETMTCGSSVTVVKLETVAPLQGF